MKRSECELEETLSNRAQVLPWGGSAHRVAVGLLQRPWHLDCHQLRGSPEGRRVCAHVCALELIGQRPVSAEAANLPFLYQGLTGLRTQVLVKL